MRSSGTLMVKRLLHSRDVPSAYVRSRFRSTPPPEFFDQVEAYAMFIGYARSGHSLLGSLLSAHPDIVISHELDALRYVRLGFGRDQLFRLILEKDAQFTSRHRRSSGYQYVVPEEWQGRIQNLRVIGDKKAANSSKRLSRDPALFGRLQKTVGVPVRIIQVTRNPYDNISTLARKNGDNLEQAIDRYFRYCSRIERIREVAGENIWHVRQEDLIADPHGSLRDTCVFLGVEARDEYLRNCAQIIFPSPRRTRSQAPWRDELIDRVRQEVEKYPTLRGYSFQE